MYIRISSFFDLWDDNLNGFSMVFFGRTSMSVPQNLPRGSGDHRSVAILTIELLGYDLQMVGFLHTLEISDISSTEMVGFLFVDVKKHGVESRDSSEFDLE